MSDEFNGPIIMRFKPGPKAHEHEDIAEEYIIVDDPNVGPMVYGLYNGTWMANPYNMRPVVRHLLLQREALRHELNRLMAVIGEEDFAIVEKVLADTEDA